MAPDTVAAASWYRRALALGIERARPALLRLGVQPDR
jgi:hypothetical protein